MIYTSNLARKIIDKSLIDQTIDNIFWIEKKLQFAQPWGVVAALKKAKNDINYADKIFKIYKKSYRSTDILDMSDCISKFNILQVLESDFDWKLWSDIKSIENEVIFEESCYIARREEKNIYYALTVYNNKIIEYNKKIDKINRLTLNEVVKLPERSISEAKKNEWNELRGLL